MEVVRSGQLHIDSREVGVLYNGNDFYVAR